MALGNACDLEVTDVARRQVLARCNVAAMLDPRFQTAVKAQLALRKDVQSISVEGRDTLGNELENALESALEKGLLSNPT